jgi:hypothetical protein
MVSTARYNYAAGYDGSCFFPTPRRTDYTTVWESREKQPGFSSLPWWERDRERGVLSISSPSPWPSPIKGEEKPCALSPSCKSVV